MCVIDLEALKVGQVLAAVGKLVFPPGHHFVRHSRWLSEVDVHNCLLVLIAEVLSACW